MKAYHRIDPIMDERKSHYTPAQLGAFVKVQLVAGRQTRRGRFRSLQAIKAALPAAYAKLVDFMVEQGDIVPASRHQCSLCPEGPSPRGELYIDGWDEWQEGDLTVGDRMRRMRGRRRNTTVTDDRNDAVTDDRNKASPAAIGVGVGVGVGVESPGETVPIRATGAGSGMPESEPDELEIAVDASCAPRIAGANRQATMRGLARQLGRNHVLSVLRSKLGQDDAYGLAHEQLVAEARGERSEPKRKKSALDRPSGYFGEMLAKRGGA